MSTVEDPLIRLILTAAHVNPYRTLVKRHNAVKSLWASKKAARILGGFPKIRGAILGDSIIKITPIIRIAVFGVCVRVPQFLELPFQKELVSRASALERGTAVD